MPSKKERGKQRKAAKQQRLASTGGADRTYQGNAAGRGLSIEEVLIKNNGQPSAVLDYIRHGNDNLTRRSGGQVGTYKRFPQNVSD